MISFILYIIMSIITCVTIMSCVVHVRKEEPDDIEWLFCAVISTGWPLVWPFIAITYAARLLYTLVKR